MANNLNDTGNDRPGLLLGKSVSLKQMTTRTHHPGRHAVHARVNGVTHCIGHFDVVAGGGGHKTRRRVSS